MNIENFRVLNLRRLGERKLRTAASILGIASGVSLVVAMLALLTSVTATAESTVDLLGGARAEVTSTVSVTAAKRAEIEKTKGVTAVAEFVQTPMLIDGAFGWMIALESPSQELSTPVSRELAGIRGVSVGSGFRPTESMKLTSPDGQTVTVPARTRSPKRLQSFFAGKFVAADIDTARQLGASGASPRPTSLLVFGNPNIDDLRRVMGPGALVEPTKLRVARAERLFSVLVASLGILGSMGLVVGAFLLYNTMNMAVLDRRHEIAALRALGGTSKTIWSGLLGEALLLGGVGSALGLLLGRALAISVVGTIPDAFARTIGTPLRASVPLFLMGPIWIIGVLTALIASVGPIRRTLGIQPIEALRPDAVSTVDSDVTIRPIPVVFGVVWFALVMFTNVVPPAVSVGLTIIPVLLLTYGLARPISAFVCALAKRLGKNGDLAALALQRSPRRVWATTSTVLVSIAIAVAGTGNTINLYETGAKDHEVGKNSEFWIGTTSGDNIGLTGLPAQWQEEIAAIPGVRSVAGTRWIGRSVGVRSIGILGVLNDSSYSYYRLADDAARAQVRAGKGVIVTTPYLDRFKAKVGDVIELPGANPPLRLPIVGSSYGITATEGLISVSMDLFSQHYGISEVGSYEAQLEPGADRAKVKAALDEIVATSSFPVRVETGEQFTTSAIEAGNQVLSLIAVVLLVITICAGIAMLNTLLASVLDRTREIAVLRAIGATQRQLVRSVMIESLAMGVTGGLLGWLAGTLLHRIMAERIADMTAFHIKFEMTPITLLMALLAGSSIALIGGTIPSRRVASLNLLESLGR